MIVDHPGFDWKNSPSQGMATARYMATVCGEQDPELRSEKMKSYQSAGLAAMERWGMPVKD